MDYSRLSRRGHSLMYLYLPPSPTLSTGLVLSGCDRPYIMHHACIRYQTFANNRTDLGRSHCILLPRWAWLTLSCKSLSFNRSAVKSSSNWRPRTCLVVTAARLNTRNTPDLRRFPSRTERSSYFEVSLGGFYSGRSRIIPN